MPCHEGSHITQENKNFTISLLHLFPVHHIIWNNFLGKFIRQQKCFASKKKIIRLMAGITRGVPCRKLFEKFNMLPLTSKFLLSLLLFVWTTWKNFKQIQIYTT
jgi:hypothetical protein